MEFSEFEFGDVFKFKMVLVEFSTYFDDDQMCAAAAGGSEQSTFITSTCFAACHTQSGASVDELAFRTALSDAVGVELLKRAVSSPSPAAAPPRAILGP